MKLADRVAVEPLGEERMTNIERRVVARAADAASRRRAPRRGHGLLIAGAMAAAALAGWVLHAPDGATRIAEAPPLRVHTTAGAVMDIGDARIESAADTAFVVTRPAGGVRVDLTSGRVALEVGKRGGRPPLVVRAGDTDVVVVGTRFSVGLTGAVADVQVSEGVVRVVHERTETRVAAGHGWRADTGLVALAAPTGVEAVAVARRDDEAPAHAAPDDGQLAVIPARSDGNGIAPPTVSAAPGDDEARRLRPAQPMVSAAPGDGEVGSLRAGQPAVSTRGGEAPAIATSDAPAPRAIPTAARDGEVPPTRATPRATRDSEMPRPRAAGGGEAAPPPAPPARPQTPSTTRSSPRGERPAIAPAAPLAELHAAIRAQRVEPALDLGESDAEKAVARYYDLAAHRSGDEASQAFYSIAVVKHLRLGRNAEAMQALDGYVRRFPGGKQYRAALWLRVRILCAGTIDDRCRAAAYTFVHAAGDDPAAQIAERITLSD